MSSSSYNVIKQQSIFSLPTAGEIMRPGFQSQTSARRLAADQVNTRKGCMRGKGGPENATCKFKGVRQRTWGKWVSEIREPRRGSRLWLGTFHTALDAALAYDAAAIKIYGPNATINVPRMYQIPFPEPPEKQIDENPFVNGNLDMNFPVPKAGPEFNDGYGNAVAVLDEQIVSPFDNNINGGGYIEMLEKDKPQTFTGFWGHLENELPGFDDSSIWAEAEASIPGIFNCNFDAAANFSWLF